MALPGAAGRRRRTWVRGAIADTRAELDELNAHGGELAVARATRGTLHALEDELDGEAPPLEARPTKGWSPRDEWLARASDATAYVLSPTTPRALATLQAIEREREARGA